MLGAIIGDIAGSRFEWHNTKNKSFELLSHIKHCRPTDDSVMTLAVAQAILDSSGSIASLGQHAIKQMQRLGILEKLRPGLYRIRRQLRSLPPTLTAWQKKLITDLFRLFGTGTFTREDVSLSLGHAKSTLSMALHQFTMIGILEYRKGRIYIYRLLADPVDNPEFFSDGTRADNDLMPDRIPLRRGSRRRTRGTETA